jgi:hypothetical protein
MISLRWSYKKPELKIRGEKIIKKEGGNLEGISNRFGFEPVRYQMQTNMIGRVLNGYVCGGCKK